MEQQSSEVDRSASSSEIRTRQEFLAAIMITGRPKEEIIRQFQRALAARRAQDPSSPEQLIMGDLVECLRGFGVHTDGWMEPAGRRPVRLSIWRETFSRDRLAGRIGVVVFEDGCYGLVAGQDLVDMRDMKILPLETSSRLRDRVLCCMILVPEYSMASFASH